MWMVVKDAISKLEPYNLQLFLFQSQPWRENKEDSETKREVEHRLG